VYRRVGRYMEQPDKRTPPVATAYLRLAHVSVAVEARRERDDKRRVARGRGGAAQIDPPLRAPRAVALDRDVVAHVERLRHRVALEKVQRSVHLRSTAA
jgi:hypothetical protein